MMRVSQHEPKSIRVLTAELCLFPARMGPQGTKPGMLLGSRWCSHPLRMQTNRLCLRLPADTQAHIPWCCAPPHITPAANGVCQSGPSATAPSHLPGPMPFCYLEMPHAHSLQDFWTGTPRMPPSCICRINSFSPVFVVIF